VIVHPILAQIRRWRMHTLKPFGHISTETSPLLSLGDRNGDVARALADAFAGVPAVQVLEGDLLDADCEAIVSPANSFGDMGGGIDKAIDDLHQGQAQQAVRAAIAERFFGELPVGMALIVEVPGPRLPFIVAAPTMRVPGKVGRTLNAYLSMRAALVAVLRHNAFSTRPIRTLAVPGLGTGVGGLGAADAAAQMRTAYDQIIGGTWRQVLHPAMAPYVTRD
jgi:O-acetyl-ADP-ribose deacetylase (regulator of RNase III)